MAALGEWNHVYEEGDDWSQTSIINLYITAIVQRSLSFDIGAHPPFEDMGDLIGDSFDVSNWTFWRSIQLQYIDADMPVENDWIIYDDYDGAPFDGFTQSISEVVLPLTTTAIRESALNGNPNYTRKYPKEFFDFASTVYFKDATAFVDGDYARKWLCLS